MSDRKTRQGRAGQGRGRGMAGQGRTGQDRTGQAQAARRRQTVAKPGKGRADWKMYKEEVQTLASKRAWIDSKSSLDAVGDLLVSILTVIININIWFKWS